MCRGSLLLRGDIPGWVATGNVLYLPSYKLHARAVPVCRYFVLRPPHSSHFFSAEAECATVGAMPGTILESDEIYYGHAEEAGV